jgi:hypothetical protein
VFICACLFSSISTLLVVELAYPCCRRARTALFRRHPFSLPSPSHNPPKQPNCVCVCGRAQRTHSPGAGVLQPGRLRNGAGQLVPQEWLHRNRTRAPEVASSSSSPASVRVVCSVLSTRSSFSPPPRPPVRAGCQTQGRGHPHLPHGRPSAGCPPAVLQEARPSECIRKSL